MTVHFFVEAGKKWRFATPKFLGCENLERIATSSPVVIQKYCHSERSEESLEYCQYKYDIDKCVNNVAKKRVRDLGRDKYKEVDSGVDQMSSIIILNIFSQKNP